MPKYEASEAETDQKINFQNILASYAGRFYICSPFARHRFYAIDGLKGVLPDSIMVVRQILVLFV